MSPSQVAFFSSNACIYQIMALLRKEKKGHSPYKDCVKMLLFRSLNDTLNLLLREVLLSLMHPFVYFPLPDSLIGLLGIISSLGVHLSLKATLHILIHMSTSTL